jgi:hypothetical protein
MNNVLSQLKWPLTALIVMAGLYLTADKLPSMAPQPLPGPAPVVPTTNLSTLVPDPEARAKLSQFYSDLAVVTRDANCPAKTTGQWRTAYRYSVSLMQSAGRIVGVAAIDAPVDQRIRLALGGLEDKPLDSTSRTTLAATLDQVAFELGGGNA